MDETLTINQIRTTNGLEPIEGGDVTLKDLEVNLVKDTAVMYLDDVQTRLKEWQEANFDPENTSYEWCFMGAVEEIGEIAHILLKSRQGIREYKDGLTDEVKDKIADGCSDVLVFLLQICSHLSIRFAPFFFEEVERVMARNWREKKDDGVKA